MDHDEFVRRLDGLHYTDWLFDELFTRLDSDGSGNISIGELTRFLEKDPPPARPSFAPKVPPGSPKRQRQLITHTAGEASVRLESLMCRKGPGKTLTLEGPQPMSSQELLATVGRGIQDRQRRRC